MEKIRVLITNVSPDLANQLAHDLASHLGTDNIAIIKDSKNTQDLGSILAIVLGAKSVIEIGKGIADWLRSKNQVEISIEDENGKVLIKKASGGDIPKFLNAIKALRN